MLCLLPVVAKRRARTTQLFVHVFRFQLVVASVGVVLVYSATYSACSCDDLVVQTIVWASFKCVPQLLPPRAGWGLFICYINAGVFATLRVVLLVAEANTGLPLAPASPRSSTSTVASAMIAPMLAQAAGCLILFTNVQVTLTWHDCIGNLVH